MAKKRSEPKGNNKAACKISKSKEHRHCGPFGYYLRAKAQGLVPNRTPIKPAQAA
jgi:hypothetical protein